MNIVVAWPLAPIVSHQIRFPKPVSVAIAYFLDKICQTKLKQTQPSATWLTSIELCSTDKITCPSFRNLSKSTIPISPISQYMYNR